MAQNPKDVSKQVALWEALFTTSHKDGYSKVIGQWERIAEFVSLQLGIVMIMASFRGGDRNLRPRSCIRKPRLKFT